MRPPRRLPEFSSNADPACDRPATAKRTRIPFTPNVFLFVDGRLAWHGDPDPALEAHSGFRRAIAAALDETATAA